jgi:hypothetical protein
VTDGGRADRVDDILGVAVLDEIADRPRGQGGGEAVLLGEGRQDDDVGVRGLLADPSGRLDAVHDRHRQVHEDNVRGQARHHRQGIRAIAGLTDHLDVVGKVEQGA